MATISINFAYKLQAFWQEWNIRIFVLLSQFLQVVLYVALPYRRCISNSFILLLINGTYVVSFIVAGTALAYISSGMPDQKGYQPPLVLWASFMLLHLSGDGYTTVHTLDDYKKWYIRFINFIFHDLVMFFVAWFQWRQVAVPGSWAFILALAYFFAIIQLTRLRSRIGDSRKHSSNNDSRDEEEVEETRRTRDSRYGGKQNEKGVTTTFDEMKAALENYHSSKKVIRGLRLTTNEREGIRRYFLYLDAKTALRIVEGELNIAFDVYFITGVDPPIKGQVGPTTVVGLFFHAGVVGMLIALGIKISFLSGSALEDNYKGTDTLITRILCFCMVFPYIRALLLKLSWFYSITVGRRNKCVDRSLLASLLSRILPSSWSRTISRRSFMTECFIEAAMSRNSFINIFRRWYVTLSPPGSQSYKDEVGEFIFTSLKRKAAESSEAENGPHRVFESKGDLTDQVLLDQPRLASHKKLLKCWPYHMRLLRWHIATEILYYTNDCNQPARNECREMSNLLSEYLMHLTFQRCHIMSTFQGNFIFSYQDTSRYIRSNKEEFGEWCRWGRPPSKDILKTFYEMMTHGGVKEEKQICLPPVVRDALNIAQVLKGSLQDRNVLWEVISEVWVDMLVYAATHCDPMAHVEKLAEGGELITIVWLLSVHFGFGDFFLPKEETEIPEDDPV